MGLFDFLPWVGDDKKTTTTAANPDAYGTYDPKTKTGTGIFNQDPNKTVTTLNGINYNFAGDPIATPKDPAPDAALAASQARLKQLEAQLAQQPKLIPFDALSNYRQAKETASRAQNTLFDEKLNNLLSGLNLERRTATGNAQMEKSSIQKALDQYIEQSNVDRTRTAEDTTTAIEGININEGRFQRDEGTQFDRARNQLAEDIAASGLGGSGIGQGQLAEQQTDRNVASADVTQDFQRDRQAKLLYQDRTFDDIARGVRVEGEKSESQKQKVDFDLDATLEDVAIRERVGRLSNSADRMGAIIQDTRTRADQGVSEFIASLVAKGARPQDIALARQIYG